MEVWQLKYHLFGLLVTPNPIMQCHIVLCKYTKTTHMYNLRQYQALLLITGMSSTNSVSHRSKCMIEIEDTSRNKDTITSFSLSHSCCVNTTIAKDKTFTVNPWEISVESANRKRGFHTYNYICCFKSVEARFSVM